VHDESWRDTSVRFVGPAVMSLQAAFIIGWGETSGTLLAGTRYFPAEGFAPVDSTVAGLLYAVPTHGSTPAERFLVASIAGAGRTLYITNSYFIPDDDQRHLLEQAAQRGVDVRILTAGRHTDMKSVRLAGRAQYEELLEAGVKIYEYQPSMIHAKTLVVDGLWATVGTMNFDNRSATLNEESNLVMMDAALGARLDSIFFRDLEHAREIRLESFRERPWYQHILEWGATLASPLL
jgi:cardiolipin synthase